MLLLRKVVEYIGAAFRKGGRDIGGQVFRKGAPFRKGAAFRKGGRVYRCCLSGKVVEYIVEVLLEGKVL